MWRTRTGVANPAAVEQSSFEKCRFEHLRRWGAHQTFRGSIDPADQPPILALWRGKEVATVYADSWASGEAEPPSLLIAFDRDQLYLGLQTLLRKHLS